MALNLKSVHVDLSNASVNSVSEKGIHMDQVINWKQTHNLCLGKFTL